MVAERRDRSVGIAYAVAVLDVAGQEATAMTGQSFPRSNVIWREGDRVEIHGATRWDGCRGRITTQYPPSELDPSWIAVAIDGRDGVFVFKDHELTRIGDD